MKYIRYSDTKLVIYLASYAIILFLIIFIGNARLEKAEHQKENAIEILDTGDLQ